MGALLPGDAPGRGACLSCEHGVCLIAVSVFADPPLPDALAKIPPFACEHGFRSQRRRWTGRAGGRALDDCSSRKLESLVKEAREIMS